MESGARAADDVIDAPASSSAEASRVVGIARDRTSHHQVEQTVGDSRATLKAILDAALDCVVSMDHDGKVVEFNLAAEKTFGYKRSDVIGKQMAELIVPPSLRESHYRGMAHYLATGEGPVIGERIEITAMRADGSEFPIELGITVVEREGPPLFTAYIRDISERKEAEDALRCSEERFRLVIEGVKDYGLFMLDPDGHVVSWNEGAKRIKGYEHDEIVGKHFSVFCPEEDVMAGKPELQLKTAATEGRFEEEGWRVRKDGSRFWANVVITPTYDGVGRLRGFSEVCRDITETHRVQQQLRASEERFRLLVEGVKDYGLCMLDAGGHIVSWNEGARRMEGFEEEEVLGRHFSLFYPEEDVTAGKPEMELEVASAEGKYEEEGWRVRKDGSRFWAHVVITATYDDDGNLRGFSKVTRDITERRKLEERLTHQALHDPLTGLPNRTLFLDRVAQAVARSKRRTSNAAVMFLDLDRFKLINDSLSHSAGDQLLISLANRLRRVLRPGDTAARFGGDEFTVLCEDIASEEDAGVIAQRIVDAIQMPVTVAGGEVVVSASVGVVLAAGADDTPEGLLRDADAAMYRAKEEGKGRYEVFDEHTRGRAAKRLSTETDLRRAVDQDEFAVLFQPQIDLKTGAIAGVEALVRWNHPERGLVGPIEFISLAEETGLIVPIGEWVLRESCRQAVRWHEDYSDGPRFTVAVNFSGRQLVQRNVADVLAEVLSDARVDPGTVSLEITESVLMGDVGSTITMLHALKDLGVRLAIDDFGTGYSSLTYLRRFPVDVMKVDQSFVEGLGKNTDDATIVEAMIGMAHALGLTAIAEGVENKDQLAELRRLGCDYAQGYYFARPQPREAIDELLKSDPRW